MHRVPFPDGVARPTGRFSYVERDTPGARRRTSIAGVVRRTSHLLAPAERRAPRPVIVALHGAERSGRSGRSGRSMIDVFRGLVDARGPVLVTPDSLSEGWTFADDGPDLLVEVPGHASGAAAIDFGRVFLFGHSAGAMLALFLIDRAPGLWRAAAAHGGPPGADVVRRARVAAPVRVFLGERDHRFDVPSARATADAPATAPTSS